MLHVTRGWGYTVQQASARYARRHVGLLAACQQIDSVIQITACALLWSRHSKEVSCEVQLSKGTRASLQLPALCTVTTGDMLAHENAVNTPMLFIGNKRFDDDQTSRLFCVAAVMVS